MKRIFFLLVLVSISGCIKNWNDPAENPCAGFKVKVGSMGESDAGKQLVFLLMRYLPRYGFEVVNENENGTLTGITTTAFGDEGKGQNVFVTAELNDTTGKELWGDYFKPHPYGAYHLSSIERRAAEISKFMAKACRPEWKK